MESREDSKLFHVWMLEALSNEICYLFLNKEQRCVSCMCKYVTVWTELSKLIPNLNDSVFEHWLTLSTLVVYSYQENNIKRHYQLIKKIPIQGRLLDMPSHETSMVMKFLNTMITLSYYDSQNIRKARSYMHKNEVLYKDQINYLLNIKTNATCPEELKLDNLQTHLSGYIEVAIKKLGKPRAYRVINNLSKYEKSPVKNKWWKNLNEVVLNENTAPVISNADNNRKENDSQDVGQEIKSQSLFPIVTVERCCISNLNVNESQENIDGDDETRPLSQYSKMNVSCEKESTSQDLENKEVNIKKTLDTMIRKSSRLATKNSDLPLQTPSPEKNPLKPSSDSTRKRLNTNTDFSLPTSSPGKYPKKLSSNSTGKYPRKSSSNASQMLPNNRRTKSILGSNSDPFELMEEENVCDRSAAKPIANNDKNNAAAPDDSGETVQWSDDEEVKSSQSTSSVFTNKPIKRDVKLIKAPSDVSTFQIRSKFTSDEEAMMIDGVAKYGVGKWAKILSNYPFLPCRTSVSIKDKYRTMKKQGHFT